MKKVLRRWIMMAFLLLGMFSINISKAQGSISLQVFYDELQPYGNWMEYNNYGYVWSPNVDRDFTPYSTNGYWVNTEYGNTWVSDYDWGWAPFHYGRWFHDDYYGWMWAPDTEWAPAWVAWRSGGGYYGWAPLMPGFSINVSFNYYNNLPNHYWNFVPYRYITYHTLHHHCVQRPQVINIINQTTIITNNYTDGRRRTFFTGPTRNEMERNGHERVQVYSINDRSRPGRSDIDRGSVSFYKPEIDRNQPGRSRPAPSQLVRGDQKGNGNKDGAESRGQRHSDFNTNQSIDDARMNANGNTREHRQQDESKSQPRTFPSSDRSQQRQSQNDNRSFDQQREKINQNQQRSDLQQRLSQIDQQNRSNQSVRDYAQSNSEQRTKASTQQHSNQRKTPNDQHSTVSPNSNQRSQSQPQRQQQVRTKSFEHQSSQPPQQTGGNKSGSSRKRN